MNGEIEQVVAMGNPAQLQNDDDVQKVAEKRLRTSNSSGYRRRAADAAWTMKRWLTVIGAVVTAAPALLFVPDLFFQSDAEAQQAQAAILQDQEALSREIAKERQRNDGQDVILGQINGKLDRGEILALKAERRGLKADIDATPQGAVKRRLEQQLEEVEEDLRLKGVQ